jgi:hypothetical protein
MATKPDNTAMLVNTMNQAQIIDWILTLPLAQKDRVLKYLGWLQPVDLDTLRLIAKVAHGDWRRAAIAKRIKELESV